MDLIIELSDNVTGSINGMDKYDYPLSFNHNWRRLQTLINAKAVSSELQEFNSECEHFVFIFSKLGVTPGTTYKVKLGIGYPKGSRLGAHGNYHYGEFVLKKITAAYVTR
jgi:hypothetical protein